MSMPALSVYMRRLPEELTSLEGYQDHEPFRALVVVHFCKARNPMDGVTGRKSCFCVFTPQQHCMSQTMRLFFDLLAFCPQA